MGSRITRAVFREERSRAIDQGRAPQIQTLTASFLSFISALSFFLYGYLYRPYLPFSQYLLMLLLLLFYFLRRPKASALLAILLGVILLLALLICSMLSLDSMGFKGILILGIALFAADS